jgi:hypothetical protein
VAIAILPFTALCGLLFRTVLTGVPFSSVRAALMPDVLPGDKFVLGSAIGNITFQASQILGFVAGAAVIAVLHPHKTLAIAAATFTVSALIVLAGVRSRPGPAGPGRRDPGPRYGLSPRTASGSSACTPCKGSASWPAARWRS